MIVFRNASIPPADPVIRLRLLSFYLRGDGEIRTLDPLLARQVLSQLSYTPNCSIGDQQASAVNSTSAKARMGLSGLEPPTSRLSGVRSNLLSYKPLNLAPACSPIPSPA